MANELATTNIGKVLKVFTDYHDTTFTEKEAVEFAEIEHAHSVSPLLSTLHRAGVLKRDGSVVPPTFTLADEHKPPARSDVQSIEVLNKMRLDYVRKHHTRYAKALRRRGSKMPVVEAHVSVIVQVPVGDTYKEAQLTLKQARALYEDLHKVFSDV